MLRRSWYFLTVISATACVGLGSHPTPAQWLLRGPRDVEHKFNLPSASVRFDTSTETLDSIIGGDSTAYYVWTVAGGKSWRELKHDSTRLDRRPDLRIYFAWPAVRQLGYLQGRVLSFDPFAMVAWRAVPDGQPLRYVDVVFDCESEGCGGARYRADSLAHVWARR